MFVKCHDASKRMNKYDICESSSSSSYLLVLVVIIIVLANMARQQQCHGAIACAQCSINTQLLGGNSILYKKSLPLPFTLSETDSQSPSPSPRPSPFQYIDTLGDLYIDHSSLLVIFSTHGHPWSAAALLCVFFIFFIVFFYLILVTLHRREVPQGHSFSSC